MFVSELFQSRREALGGRCYLNLSLGKKYELRGFGGLDLYMLFMQSATSHCTEMPHTARRE